MSNTTQPNFILVGEGTTNNPKEESKMDSVKAKGTSIWTSIKGATVRFSKAVGSVIAAGAKKVASFAKDNWIELVVGAGAAVVGGAVTGCIMGAALVGAGVAAAVMAAMWVIKAKREKQALDYRKMVESILVSAGMASLVPYLATYGLLGLVYAFDWAFYECLELLQCTVAFFAV